MPPLHMALGFFPKSPLGRWPGLAYYFMGWSLYRACGARLFGQRTLHLGGFKVSADVEGKSGLVFLHEILVRDIYRVRSLCQGPAVKVVFDAGANCGFFALTCAALKPDLQVCCFEPHPATFKHLQENIRANAWNDRVRAVPAAVGSAAGQCELRVSDASSMGIVATSTTQFLENPKTVRVEVMALDDYAARQRLWPDVLKIDVEGFEVEALKGAAQCLKRARRVVLEFHSDALRDECRARLEEAGFEVAIDDDLMFASRTPGA